MVGSQKGFTSILILVILLIVLGLGVYLVQQKTNLFPKANEISPSDNTLLSRINDLEAKSEKIDSNQISGERTVKVPIEVFEDLNKNGIKDEGEVGIPNMHVQGTAFVEISSSDKPEFKPLLSLPYDGETNANGAFEFSWVTPGILTKGDQEFRVVPKTFLINVGTFDKGNIENAFPVPIGWSKTNSLSFKLYPSDPTETIITNPSGDTVLETAEFPLIGNQKISGQVFYDNNRNGIRDGDELQSDRVVGGVNILIDATKANNATKKIYYGTTKEDGTYEIDNLPPLSQYRVKAALACPYVATVPAQFGYTLGSTLTAQYNFGVIYDENDPCVTN